MVLPRALEFSSHPPVLVYGTGKYRYALETFLGTSASVILFWLLKASTACQVSAIGEWIFLSLPAYTLRATIPSVTSHSPMRPPSRSIVGIGILTDFPSLTPSDSA